MSLTTSYDTYLRTEDERRPTVSYSIVNHLNIVIHSTVNHPTTSCGDLIWEKDRRGYITHQQLTFNSQFLKLKAEVNLNAIFTPLNMDLMGISRSRFKQSKNALLIS